MGGWTITESGNKVGVSEMDRWTITESGSEVGGNEMDRWAITESGREVGVSETDRQSQRVGERWEGGRQMDGCMDSHRKSENEKKRAG